MFAFLALVASAVADESACLPPEVAGFIDAMAQKHGFDRARLVKLFQHVQFQQRILDLITRPAETKPWSEYRQIFITPKRIVGGVEFWDEYAKALSRARAAYGVPEDVITAIIGVETLYGERIGSFPVLDALATLAFDYPKRSAFFSSELEQYLLLARDNGFDPRALSGSYAGAIGIPQFMPSSYRRYAVDFDGDGKVDLAGSPVDAIGSVANYLLLHGWASGEPVAVRAQVSGADPETLLDGGIKPRRTVAQLKALGVTPLEEIPDDAKAALLEFDTGEEKQYWLALNNFYVITRYNASPYYAMAVAQLAEQIHLLHEAMAKQRRAEREGLTSRQQANSR